MTQLGVTGDDLIDSFGPYRPDGLTAALAIENLTAKLGKPEFRSDLDPLTTSPPTDYDIDNAAGLIVEAVLRRL